MHSLGQKVLIVNTRMVCSTLQETVEIVDGFGNITFQVHGKSFVKLMDRAGLCMKSNREIQELLIQKEKFFVTPYIGRYGWVSIHKRKIGKN